MTSVEEYDEAMAQAGVEMFKEISREMMAEADRLVLTGRRVVIREGLLAEISAEHDHYPHWLSSLGLSRAEVDQYYRLLIRRGMRLVDGSALLMKFKADGGTVPP